MSGKTKKTRKKDKYSDKSHRQTEPRIEPAEDSQHNDNHRTKYQKHLPDNHRTKYQQHLPGYGNASRSLPKYHRSSQFKWLYFVFFHFGNGLKHKSTGPSEFGPSVPFSLTALHSPQHLEKAAKTRSAAKYIGELRNTFC